MPNPERRVNRFPREKTQIFERRLGKLAARRFNALEKRPAAP
jgi:hypothetical protein